MTVEAIIGEPHLVVDLLHKFLLNLDKTLVHVVVGDWEEAKKTAATMRDTISEMHRRGFVDVVDYETICENLDFMNGAINRKDEDEFMSFYALTRDDFMDIWDRIVGALRARMEEVWL